MSEHPLYPEIINLVRTTHDEARAGDLISCPRVFLTLTQSILGNERWSPLFPSYLLQYLLAWALDLGDVEAWQELTYQRCHDEICFNWEEFAEALAGLKACGFIEIDMPTGEGRRVRVRMQPLLDALDRHLQEREGGEA